MDDIVSEDDTGLTVDVTHICGGFSAPVLQKMSDIICVDISGCTHLDASEFVEGIVSCIQMEKLLMVGCSLFTEYNIVDICTSLPNLIHLDSRKCSGLQYANAHVILCNARNLKIFKVEMKYPQYEKKDWLKHKYQFPRKLSLEKK